MRGADAAVVYLPRMPETMRSCSRTGCRWPAAASLSFRYASSQVWLLDLADPDPSLYDLCPHHADALVVPRGWERVDQRTAHEVVREPSAREIADRAAARRVRSGRVPAMAGAAVGGGSAPPPPAPPAPPAPHINRYADLARELPRLAAELTAAGPAGSTVAHQAAASAGPDGSPAEPPSRPPPPRPSRELAPVPPVDPRYDQLSGGGPAPLAERPPELAGQLAIPVEVTEADAPDAVILSIERLRRPSE